MEPPVRYRTRNGGRTIRRALCRADRPREDRIVIRQLKDVTQYAVHVGPPILRAVGRAWLCLWCWLELRGGTGLVQNGSLLFCTAKSSDHTQAPHRPVPTNPDCLPDPRFATEPLGVGLLAGATGTAHRIPAPGEEDRLRPLGDPRVLQIVTALHPRARGESWRPLRRWRPRGSYPSK